MRTHTTSHDLVPDTNNEHAHVVITWVAKIIIIDSS